MEISENNKCNGYISGKMIVLHKPKYDHDEHGKPIYIPNLFVVNPKHIICFETTTEYGNIGTRLYFVNNNKWVYESVEEILELLSKIEQ